MALLKISEPGKSPMPHQFKRAVGIDLGTTNSLVATVPPGKSPHVIVDAQGDALLPSVVHYAEDQINLVGQPALDMSIADPHNTLASFKRWMGRSIDDIQSDDSYDYVRPDAVDGSPDASKASALVAVHTRAGAVTAVEASAEVLKNLAARAESALGGQLQGAVITVPAYFDDAQRQATKDAAMLAGVNVLRLINEPTAAAVAYGLDKADDRYIAVYDLGGGTFDVSILQLSEGVFEVLATGGNAALGGDDFDRAIADWVLAQAAVSAADLGPSAYRQLLQESRAAKQALSEHRAVGLAVAGNGVDWAGELSRQQFEELIDGLVEQTLAGCKASLADADLVPSDIGDVVMVGGSTRVPRVREKVALLFDQEPKIDVDPDQVVALGAAIQADMLVGNNQERELLLLDVLPLSLGIETMGGLVEKIIHRNTSIPCTRGQEFTTYKDGQTALALHVLQGERERVADCRSLARFELRGIPAMVAGAAHIQVTFDVDANGMLEVSACETNTGVAASIKVQPSYGLAESQITAMLQASHQFARDDLEVRALIEQRIEAESLLDAVQAALQADRHLLDASEVQRIDSAITELAAAAKQDEVVSIKDAIARLGHQTEAFAARRMNQSIKQALQGRHIDAIADPVQDD